VKSHKPYLSSKMVFLAPEIVLYLSGTLEKNFFFDFEPYDLTNSKELVSKIWWACRHTSQLQDLTVGSTKRLSIFGHFTLFSIGADLRPF
jgi:hypothetical protein